MAKQILDLKGNIFEVKSRYRLVLDYPLFNKALYSMTRDRFSDKGFTLIEFKSGRYYAMYWIQHLNLYLLKELKFIRYEEKYDIRYEWKYRKEIKEFYKRIGKIAKT